MKRILILFALLISTVASHAASFRNLGFDEADLSKLAPVPGVPPGAGNIADIMPGWQLSLSGNPYSLIRVNLFGAPGDPILPNALLVDQAYSSAIVDGRFALRLGENPFKNDHFSLMQTGDIPADAKFLTYTVGGNPLAVSINGTPLAYPYQNLFTATTVSLDVSVYAGQAVTLKFDGIGDPISHTGGGYFLDNISFQVPEPGTVTLFGLGGCALLAAGLRRRWT